MKVQRASDVLLLWPAGPAPRGGGSVGLTGNGRDGGYRTDGGADDATPVRHRRAAGPAVRGALAGPGALLPGGGSGAGRRTTGGRRISPSPAWTGGRWRWPVLGKKPVLLVFWATWCPECKAAIPEIDAMTTNRSAGKLQILGLAFRESREKVANAVKARGIRFPVLLDERGQAPGRTGSSGSRRTS